MLQTIYIHAKAPAKPVMGAPCNGCGVCCAAEPCPVSRRLFGKTTGPCPALHWHADLCRYECDLLREPGRYLRWLPNRLTGLARRWFARRIAAGQGCDSDATVADQVADG